MIIFVFTGLEYTRQFKKKKNTQKFHGLIMDAFCNALCRQSRVIFCAFIGLNSNKIMLTEFPVLFVNLKSLSVHFVAVTVLKYALRHINKNTTVHFLWYWILCISLQFKRNFDFVPVYVNSFHLNVTGGQFRPFVWSKPVVICSAETSSVEDIITITIIFQTTAFARTCAVFVDFVV